MTLIANAGDYTRPPDADDVRRAIKVVRRAAFTGTVERFDDACIAAEYNLRPKCGLLDCAYMAQNVTAARSESLDDRLVAFRQACGQDVYDEWLKQSELDFALHQAADAELTRRARFIPRLVDRHAVFRVRCDQLHRAAVDPNEIAPPTAVDRLLLASELDLPFYAVWEGV